METFTIRRPKRALERASKIRPFGDELRTHIKGVEIFNVKIELVKPPSTSLHFDLDDNDTRREEDGDEVVVRYKFGERFAAAKQRAAEQDELAKNKLKNNTTTTMVPEEEVKKRPPTTIRIDQLPEETIEIDLVILCRSFGPMESLYIARDTRNRDEPVDKGFAILTFQKEQHAQAAIHSITGMPWNGRVLLASLVVS